MFTAESADTFARLAANHLWQSTAFAAIVALLALALKGNHARVRHGLWLAASLKFLVPFAALAAVGGRLGQWVVPAMPVSRVPVVMEQIVQPFASVQDVPFRLATAAPAAGNLVPTVLLALWLCGFAAVLIYGWVRWRRVAVAIRAAQPCVAGREFEAWQRVQKKADGPRKAPGTPVRPTKTGVALQWSGPPGLLSVVSSSAKLEPGVFGIFRPVLWLPAGIGERLDDAELEAILAHELCHIRRRDNLTAALHMAVEALFWFHPLVWWLGARLTEERERACDEEVVRMGGEPQVYTESILKVCEFYLASPVACAAGITGGELKKRIEGIMTNRFTRELSYGKRLVLGAVALAAVAAPIAIGLVSPPRGWAQSRSGGAAPVFEVASVKPAGPFVPGAQYGMRGGPGTDDPGRLSWPRATMANLLTQAYGVWADQVSGPAWINDAAFSYVIDATIPPNTTKDQFRLMLQNLLNERFHLKLHHQAQAHPGYELTIAPGGPKMKPWTPTGKPGRSSAPVSINMNLSGRPYPVHMSFHESMESFCRGLGSDINMSNGGPMNSVQPRVVDRTGLTGAYEFTLDFAGSWVVSGAEPSSPQDAATDPVDLPNIFVAIQKQLGLKLVKVKDVPVDMLIVDNADKIPTAN